ncbi:MAG: type II toxin-antitoxin system VapB family antitoxin [Acidobacteria bacterium]|nr:type II toxin-antitoxin system VapB family antitoxin [Acidobacteriota bacterium]
MAQTAKLFWSGRSQAVRLPKPFRMEGSEVRIRRQGRKVILEPIAEDWTWLDAVAGTFSDDFFAEGRQQPAEQKRPELDTLFD